MKTHLSMLGALQVSLAASAGTAWFSIVCFQPGSSLSLERTHLSHEIVVLDGGLGANLQVPFFYEDSPEQGRRNADDVFSAFRVPFMVLLVSEPSTILIILNINFVCFTHDTIGAKLIFSKIQGQTDIMIFVRAVNRSNFINILHWEQQFNSGSIK